MSERWIKCVGFPDCEVSTIGRVRRSKMPKGHPGSAVLGAIFKQSTRKKSGYKCLLLISPSGRRVNVYVHRLVALSFRGKPPKGHEAAHHDGNGSNNRLGNIRWKTRKQNHRDKHRHGTARNQAGELNVNARLTRAVVNRIRKFKKSNGGMSYAQIGRRFGVDPSHARKICIGLRWPV